MNDTVNEQNMNLTSGIAAFEAKHFSQAMALLAPLARDGDMSAQYRLAIMYQNGLGVVRNEEFARQWMLAAAQQHHAFAQHGLGCMYLEGDCISKDTEQAVDWFTRAADQGLAGSQMMLGMMYESGNGVVPDLEQSRKWYRLAELDDDPG